MSTPTTSAAPAAGTAPAASHRRPFRFGVLAPVLGDMATWTDQARRIAEQGYSMLLMPDIPQLQPAFGATLATAAAITDLRVGTWVCASPLHIPRRLAWEAHSMTTITGGRFELGIGTGRPGIEDEVRAIGMPESAGTGRLDRLRETVTALRELDGEAARTPVAMAVRGPRALAAAAELADTVTFAHPPHETREGFTQLVHDFRAVAAGRDVELAMHVSVVGDRLAPFMGPPDLDVAALRAADSVLTLPDDPAAAAEEIRRRRDELGFSYFVVGANSAERMAPVVAELAGR